MHMHLVFISPNLDDYMLGFNECDHTESYFQKFYGYNLIISNLY